MRTTTASLLTVFGFGIWPAQALPQPSNRFNGGPRASEGHTSKEWNQHTLSMSGGPTVTPTTSATPATSASTSKVANATSAPAESSVLSQCAASLDGQLPSQTPSNFDFSGNVRRYYVAAEEMEWDYVPSGWDNWLGVS